MSEKKKSSHRSPHRKIRFSMAKKRHSDPKLHIPRKKGRPVVGPGNYWYVYFYWRTDPDGPLNKVYKFNGGINYLKTAKERRAAGKALQEAYHQALKKGWNPETKDIPKNRTQKKEKGLGAALEYAYEIKALTTKESTLNGYRFFLDRFQKWAKENGYYGMAADKFTIDDFYIFYDWLRFDYINPRTNKPISGNSVNNHRRSLSALFTVMKDERLIKTNFVKGIPNIDDKPTKNKAFTLNEVERIKKQLLQDDPYLIPVISFILYPLLRPREIFRLKVKDLKGKDFFSVETKTEEVSYRRIIDKLRPAINALQLEKYPDYCHVFTYEDHPIEWDSKLKNKVDYFGKRFKPIKEKLGFGKDYSLYSFRHTAIMNLYNSMVAKGMGEQEILHKLMPITHHKSVAGIKNYLRTHKRSIPPDHSDLYTIDF